MRTKAFTLIELLIVVAIIAILAAIAVPNFLEAQTRSKVSRAHTDMRSITTALEAYATDYNHYPPSATNFPWPKPRDGNGWIISWRDRLNPITTPVAYMTSVPNDAFGNFNVYTKTARPPFTAADFSVYQYCEDYFLPWAVRLAVSPPDRPDAGYVTYDAERRDVCWRLMSCGPDNIFNFSDPAIPATPFWQKDGMPYDATNGTISHGDIFRYGGNDKGNRNRP
jgi:prepilin-type N-terminal cleavage/methylation domain-containing protein